MEISDRSARRVVYPLLFLTVHAERPIGHFDNVRSRKSRIDHAHPLVSKNCSESVPYSSPTHFGTDWLPSIVTSVFILRTTSQLACFRVLLF